MNDPTQAFWDDLNHNLADPEFRVAFEEERMTMSTADLIARARDRVDTQNPGAVEALIAELADALEAATTTRLRTCQCSPMWLTTRSPAARTRSHGPNTKQPR